MKYAVITGDLVHFSELDVETRKWIVISLKRLLVHLDENFDTQSGLLRGDSFQIMVRNLSEALEIALIVRTYIRSLSPTEDYDIYNRPNNGPTLLRRTTKWLFDVRLGIGIGEIDYFGETLAETDGKPFHLSGSALTNLKEKRHRLAIESNDTFSDELKIIAILVDAIVSKTTALQCEVINHKLLGHTEVFIAEMLEINQSSVNQRASAGNWHAISAAVNRFQKIYEASQSV